MTAECNNRCRASLDCPAFLIDYGLEVMMIAMTKEYEWTVMMVMTFTKDYVDSDVHGFCTVILVRRSSQEFFLQACFRLDSTSEDGRELLVPSGEKTNYFEKVCLEALARCLFLFLPSARCGNILIRFA